MMALSCSSSSSCAMELSSASSASEKSNPPAASDFFAASASICPGRMAASFPVVRMLSITALRFSCWLRPHANASADRASGWMI